LSWGAGLRFGPLMLGSGSVLTNLLSDTSKTTDVFVGLKVPIYRKLYTILNMTSPLTVFGTLLSSVSPFFMASTAPK